MVNVLFVGRLIPNKRPDNVIRYFQAYRTLFNPRARLLLAGSHEHFGSYLAELHAFAARLGADDVHILGHVTNEELTALYDVADVFLCASEHEGFCVPIVEAFHKRVPVVARAATAVPATMDGGGLLYDTTDPLEVAGLIDAVVSDERSGEPGAAGAGRRCRPASGPRLRRRASRSRPARARGAARGRRSRSPPTSGGSSSWPTNWKRFAPRARRRFTRCRRRPTLRRRSPAWSRARDRQPVGSVGASRRCGRRLRAGASAICCATGDTTSDVFAMDVEAAPRDRTCGRGRSPRRATATSRSCTLRRPRR